jgi:PKD repeat protein
MNYSRTRKIALALFAGAVFFPFYAGAAVIINEIAWMGTATSANDEWIELYNSGSEAVLLDGWVLSDNVSLSIPLSGSLAPGAYGVLERTDDGSAPGAALLIYTGALSNDGRTLTLRRDDASIEDQVAGGAGWSSIGGNNTTKESAQYTGSGWVTAPATPGATNASSGTPPGSTTDEENEEEEDKDDEENEVTIKEESTAVVTATSKTRKGGGTTIRARIFEDDPLKLAVSHERQGYVHQPVQFVATPSGLPEGKLHTLQYSWNFGDGTISDERSPRHTYIHPGNYVVVASAERAGHEVMVRTEITIVPVVISLSQNERGDLLVHNNAKYEIDVSGMHISDGQTTFTLPLYTFIAPNGSLALTHTQTGLKNSFLSAHDRHGAVLAQFPDAALTVRTALPTTASYTPPVAIERPPGEILATSTTATTPPAQLAAVSTSFEETSSRSSVPFEQRAVIGFVGILLVSLLALYSHKLV